MGAGQPGYPDNYQTGRSPMILIKTRIVFHNTILACLCVMIAASNTHADGIEILTRENIGQAGVHAYLDSTTGSQAQNELIDAIQADPQFVKGSSGYALAIKALASLQRADRSPLLDNPEQIDLLLDAAIDNQLEASTRTYVIQRINIMAIVKPIAVRETVFLLLHDDDPYVLITTMQSMSDWDGLDSGASPSLLAIATDPAVANPEAVHNAQQIDEESETAWPRYNQDSGDTLVEAIRINAAIAWALSESPQSVLDHISNQNFDDDSDVWARALLAPLGNPKSAVRHADEEMKREWLGLMATVMSRPDSARVAHCCVTGTMIYFLGANPDMRDAGIEALKAIALAHQDDQSLQGSVSALIQLYN